MNDLNSVLLEGTLTADPVLSHDANGRPQCRMFVASERHLRRENGTETHTTGIPIHTEGTMAEQCMRLCRQGRKIRVVGCLQTLAGKNEEGRAVSRVVINAEHFEVKPEFKPRQEKGPSYDSYSR